MFVYVFEPHNASYLAGGGVVVVAESYERAVELATVELEKSTDSVHFSKENSEEEGAEFRRRYVDLWILKDAIPTNADQTERVVICNYNYN